MHNKELPDTNGVIKSWRMRWAGKVPRTKKKKRIAHRIHVRKPKGKLPLGRPKR